MIVTVRPPSSDLIRTISQARLIAVVHAPYLASVLFATSVLEAEGLGTIGIDERIRLYVDPEAVARWSINELAGVLIHEAHHIVRDHADRFRHVIGQPQNWNIAADLEINDDLDNAEIPLPSGAIRPSDYKLPTSHSAEWYLARIPQSIDPANLQVAAGECGSGADGQHRSYELGAQSEMCPGLGSIQVQGIRDAVVEEINRSTGHIPAGLARWAASHKRSNISWQTRLRRKIRRGVATRSGNSDYSYSKPSRRHSGRIIFPSMLSPDVNIAIVIDTSGSMSQGDLDRAYSEARAISRQAVGHRVSLVACDSEATLVHEGRLPDSVALIGGGGTDMGAALAIVADLRRIPQVVVVITDGFTPWPVTPPEKLRSSSIIVLMVAAGQTAPDWAETVEIPIPLSK